MAETNILAQVNPSAAVLTDILTLTAGALVDSIHICNQDSVAVQARLAICPSAAAINAKHYLLYDETIGPGRTLVMKFERPLRLGAETIIRGRASTANVSFNVLGS